MLNSAPTVHLWNIHPYQSEAMATTQDRRGERLSTEDQSFHTRLREHIPPSMPPYQRPSSGYRPHRSQGEKLQWLRSQVVGVLRRRPLARDLHSWQNHRGKKSREHFLHVVGVLRRRPEGDPTSRYTRRKQRPITPGHNSQGEKPRQPCHRAVALPLQQVGDLSYRYHQVDLP